MPRQLRSVRLLEPEICLECRFGRLAVVETTKGELIQRICCMRLDCDNWDHSSFEDDLKSIKD